MNTTTKVTLLTCLIASYSFGQFSDDPDLIYDVIPIESTQSQDLINTLFGFDISASTSNDFLMGAGDSLENSQIGFFTDVDQILPSSVADFSSGIVFSTGFLTDLNTTNTSTSAGGAANGGLDSAFNDGTGEYDVASISFDYTATSPAVFNGDFFFSSEEYLTYVGLGLNDGAKVFVNGVNYALTASGTHLSIDEINNVTNSSQYVDNPFSASTINFEPNGFTVKLTFSAPLNVGVNTIKIGIADRGDNLLDSWFFFAGESFIFLAAEIGDFQGTFNARDEVDLNWMTSSESGNERFDIQRSSNTKDWVTIGDVEGAGSSQVEKRYHFVDKHPGVGANYYRLAMIDVDGEKTYSKTVSVVSELSEVLLYPNPSDEFVSVSFSNAEKARVQIYNSTGIEILDQTISKGETFSLDSGVYNALITVNGRVTRQKLIIK